MSVVYGLVPFDGGVAPALAFVVGLLVDGADVREGHEDVPDLLRDVSQRVGEPYLVGPHDGQAREVLWCDVSNEECHVILGASEGCASESLATMLRQAASLVCY